MHKPDHESDRDGDEAAMPDLAAGESSVADLEEQISGDSRIAGDSR